MSLCAKPFISYEYEFAWYENEPVGETHFHMNGFYYFTQGIVLAQRQKATRM